MGLRTGDNYRRRGPHQAHSPRSARSPRETPGLQRRVGTNPHQPQLGPPRRDQRGDFAEEPEDGISVRGMGEGTESIPNLVVTQFQANCSYFPKTAELRVAYQLT